MATVYHCRNCNAVRPYPPAGVWGRCEHCGGCYRGVAVPTPGEDALGGGAISAADLLAQGIPKSAQRLATGLRGFDHVFNGGLPRKGTVLLCAAAGTGKTSLLWEVLLQLGCKDVDTLYISSEQSLEGLHAQFTRIGNPRGGKHMALASERDLPAILALVRARRPKILALDSIQKVRNVTDEHGQPMRAGHPEAVARVAELMGDLAASLGHLAFLVGHMSADGAVKGGSNLHHTVDAILALRRAGDGTDDRRYLEFEDKSRFGPLGRRALFRMGTDGMRDCGPAGGTEEEGPPVGPDGSGPPRLRLVS